MVRVDSPRPRTLSLLLGGVLAGGAFAAGSGSSRYAPAQERPARMRRAPPRPTEAMASTGMAGSGSSRAGSHTAPMDDPMDDPAGSGSSARPSGTVELASALSPEARRVHQGIGRAIVHDQALKGGYFLVVDKEARKVRVLKPRRLHETLGRVTPDRAREIVRRAGGVPAALEAAGDAPVYLACADFHDVRTGEVVDVDVWVTAGDAAVRPVQVLLHRVGGRERFTYRPGDTEPVE